MTTPSREEEREQRLKLLDDHIGRALRDSEARGELRAAPSWGRPLAFGDGYDETPDELRMAMKILKDASVVPAEVEAMQQIARLQHELAALPEGAEAARALRRLIAEKQQALALRLEQLRRTGSW